MMYLIPKNIKTKKEIFKGFGIIECIAIAISFGIGYFLTLLTARYKIKIFLFFILPLTTFILLIPLPNGTTALKILRRFILFSKRQRCYKVK